MFDYSFFALLFTLATTLAPADAREVSLINARHPEQRMTWTRGDDGRWAMTMNDRDLGHFERTGDAVFHHTGQRSPDHFPLDALLDPARLSARATRLSLRGRFSPTALEIRREDGRVVLHDPDRRLLATDLRLEHR